MHFSPGWLTIEKQRRRLRQLFPGLFSWLFTWPAERLFCRVEGRLVCVRAASPLKGTLDAWKITREMSLTFIVAVRQHSRRVYMESVVIIHTACEWVCVWYCIVESRPHCWDQRGSHLLFLIARIHNNERGGRVRYHSRLLCFFLCCCCLGEKVRARGQT